MLYSVRGATCVKKNTESEIKFATFELLDNIIKRNNIKPENITQIIFSATSDITKIYPAVCAREMGLINASLLCVQEMHVENSLRLCIRVLLNFWSNLDDKKKICHVYLNQAKILRPDLQ